MKINYDLKFKEELKKIGNTRPTLLLHVCCGPCSSNVLKEICNLFDITIYYSNSNIYPSEEYYRRYHELLDFITRFNNDFNQNITMISVNTKMNQKEVNVVIFVIKNEWMMLIIMLLAIILITGLPF